MKWLKAKKLWLKAKCPEDCPLGRKKENVILKPLKDLFPYSYPYESMYPFEKVYSPNDDSSGLKMDPEKYGDSTRVVP